MFTCLLVSVLSICIMDRSTLNKEAYDREESTVPVRTEWDLSTSQWDRQADSITVSSVPQWSDRGRQRHIRLFVRPNSCGDQEWGILGG